MNSRTSIVMIVCALVFFAFLFWSPSITGMAVVGETQKVVVILHPPIKTHITGSIVAEVSDLPIEELKRSTALAQEEVLDDINNPSLLDRLLGVEVNPQVEAEHLLEIVPAMVVEATPEGIVELENHPLVDAVYPNMMFDLVLDESVPQIEADDVWSAETPITGSGVSVCVIDTGINAAHEAFQNRIVNQKCFCSSYCCPNGQRIDDDAFDSHAYNHGSHVAGIVGANGVHKGVAPDVNIVAVKVCDSSCSLSDILSGLDYCVQVKDDYNIVAISGSIGDGGRYQTQDQCPTFFDAAIDAAYAAGITSVFATGNNGYTDGVCYPGCSPNAIAVGAVDKNDNIASFSNRGPLMEVWGPGVGILSASSLNDWRLMSGTSQATPHVSGAVALIQQYAQESELVLSPDEIAFALISTGDMINGYPRINVRAALESLGLQWPNDVPIVSISSPIEGSEVASPVTLTGSASDTEDGILTGESLVWSEGENVLGTGESFSQEFIPGEHTVTLTATDTTPQSSSSSVTFNVAQPETLVVSITSPEPEASELSPVTLTGSASIGETSITGESLTWSEDETVLGTGDSISVEFTLGEHTVSLSAIHETLEEETFITFTVEAPPSLEVTIDSPLESTLVSNPVSLEGHAMFGSVAVDSLTWSEGEVEFGTGAILSQEFSSGSHQVTLRAIMGELSAESSVSFSVPVCLIDIDQNGDSMVNIVDIVLLLNNVFSEQVECVDIQTSAECLIELDRNADGFVNVGDLIVVLTEMMQEEVSDVFDNPCFN